MSASILTLRTAFRSTSRSNGIRAFSATVMNPAQSAEGATGATRTGGAAAGDAFSKREKANEDYYVREQERSKLKAIKEKIAQQQAHLKELDKHIDELTSDGTEKK